MKKTCALVLALALTAMLSACGGSTNESSSTSTPSGSTPESSTMAAYQDGTYRIEAKDYYHGYREFMEVTYQDGSVTAVDFDAYKEDDNTILKSVRTVDIYPMRDKDGNDFTPAIWYPTLEASIQNAANPEDIELIGGASNSSRTARAMLAEVQKAAATGDTTPIVLGYVDGTYRVEAKDFSHGYKEFMEVTYKDGQVTDVNFDAYGEEDATVLKSTLTAEQYPMKDTEGNAYPPSAWYPTLEENVKKAATPDGLEMIAGATNSCESAKLFLAAIQTEAVAANIVDPVTVDTSAFAD